MPYNKNAIFMFDTLRNYLEFEAKIKIDQIQSLNLTFLTYCENLTTEVTTKEVIKTTSFQNYLIDENDKISLHSMAACWNKSVLGYENEMDDRKVSQPVRW